MAADLHDNLLMLVSGMISVDLSVGHRSRYCDSRARYSEVW
jgi:hypothetical protein